LILFTFSLQDGEAVLNNPCSAYATLCAEPACQVPFWTFNSEDHYATYHEGTECPENLKIPNAEIIEIQKDQYGCGSAYIKSSVKVFDGKGKKSQRKRSFQRANK